MNGSQTPSVLTPGVVGPHPGTNEIDPEPPKRLCEWDLICALFREVLGPPENRGPEAAFPRLDSTASRAASSGDSIVGWLAVLMLEDLHHELDESPRGEGDSSVGYEGVPEWLRVWDGG